MMKIVSKATATLIFFWGLIGLATPALPQTIIIDHTCSSLSRIPEIWIIQAKNDLHIAYQHTSHGSQLISGMNALESFPSFGTKYEWSDNGSAGLDLDDYGISGCADLSQGDSIDGNGVTPWVTATRSLLNNTANNHINVVVWSWCSIDMHNAQRYVDNMEILISEYSEGGSALRAAAHPVKFVFMTGHAQGQGEELYSDPDASGNGHVHYNNQLIRQHCTDNNRILFDFADIEAYDPDGNYFWDLNMTDALYYTGGNWGEEWIDANTGSELQQLTSSSSSCAHCDGPDNKARINCVLKGQATWWMWSRLAGWNGQTGDPSPTPTLTPVGGLTPTASPYPEVPTPTSPPVKTPTVSPTATSTPTPVPAITCDCTPPARTPTPSPTSSPPPTTTTTPSPSPASTVSIKVEGRVIDAWTNSAIMGARVYLQTEYRSHYATTNSTGDYWIITGGPTRATLSASYPGYNVSTVKTFLGIYNNDIILHLTPAVGQTGGDYDGDGTADIAIFRKGSGLWAIRAMTHFYFGRDGDLPVSGDYNGDGRSNPSIFRNTGLWAIRGLTRFYLGAYGDLPIPSDYDGDELCDIGIFRPSTGLWAIPGVTRFYFGSSGDRPLPGDYSGNGTDIVGIYRPTTGLWALRENSRIYFGKSGDSPIPGDYDGDGIYDIGIFRSYSGLWAILGVTRSYFGGGADQPVPADYAGNSECNIAIFRNSSGLWAVREVSRLYFGTENDIPVVR